ncbi:MAG: alpha/beta fold hydrolase [Rhodospirillales bacterium]
MRRRLGLLAVLALAACAPSLQPPGAKVDAERLDADRFVTHDGIELKVKAWRPQGRPRAAILALHGFNDYRNFIDESAAHWAAAGIATHAYDQRGFGEAPEPGIWAGAAALVRDAGDMARLMRARDPDLPLFLLGESMGGAVVVLAMAGERPPPVDGVILAAPALWGRRHMSGIQSGSLDFLAHAMPWFPVDGRGTGRVPSDNTAMLRRQGADPLVLKYNRIDTVYGLVNLMDEAQQAGPRFSATALILLGGNEQLIPKGPLDQFLKSLPPGAARRQRLAVYPKGYHMLLRDLNADVARRDVAAWIADRAAPLPSGAEIEIHHRGAETQSKN